ncbi:MAG: hypothetical protein BWK75_05665 [Candidatus Altiarchaeales archaeon A3]|nr:MAG: hypothetical protein BWK75_05665 [Candidatus Altiarchaeales archaeon A3]
METKNVGGSHPGHLEDENYTKIKEYFEGNKYKKIKGEKVVEIIQPNFSLRDEKVRLDVEKIVMDLIAASVLETAQFTPVFSTKKFKYKSKKYLHKQERKDLLPYFIYEGVVTATEFSDKYDYTRSYARRILYSFAKEGLLTPRKEGRETKYYLSHKIHS